MGAELIVHGYIGWGDPGIFISDYAKELHDIKKTLIDKFEDNPFILFKEARNLDRTQKMSLV